MEYISSQPIYEAKNNMDYVKAKAQHPWTHSQADENEILLLPSVDNDHFPYRRWYRGQHSSNNNYIHTRQAGYAPRLDKLYVSPRSSEQTHPYLNLRHDLYYGRPYVNTKFQTGCCTTYPSYHPDNKFPYYMQGYNSHFPLISLVNR
jgi:hypothetical protein